MRTLKKKLEKKHAERHVKGLPPDLTVKAAGLDDPTIRADVVGELVVVRDEHHTIAVLVDVACEGTVTSESQSTQR